VEYPPRLLIQSTKRDGDTIRPPNVSTILERLTNAKHFGPGKMPLAVLCMIS